MILGSSRLTLTPLIPSDHTYFHAVNTDPYVRKYLWDDQIIEPKVSAEILVKNEIHFQNDGYGLWKLESKVISQVIGYAGLWYFFDEVQPQLLYVIERPYSGFGYATEVSRLIIDYAFSTLDFDYLIAATDAEHQASQKVARQAGMKWVNKRIINGKATSFYRIDKANTV
ncbi:MAG: GNAT family N-acetyltransferase [Saprospiraceae bacterium]|nr:GNAT family N-acetyltransferase [Saprospiraceae bacterium]